jgi:predicted membrane channel-forming protein YqfA (hemolysin III family)
MHTLDYNGFSCGKNNVFCSHSAFSAYIWRDKVNVTHPTLNVFAGCVAFIGMAAYFLSRPMIELQLQEKLVFAAFFMGAILCLGMSFAFHTMCCHSEVVGKLFSKCVLSPKINYWF